MKKIYKFTNLRITIFIILISIVWIIGIMFCDTIESFINNKFKTNQITYKNLVCHFLDVNQGDCIIIELPDNKILIIDSGNTDNESQAKLTNSLNEIFKNRPKVVDYLILTHSDSDHCGGMVSIFNNFRVRNFYRPPQFVYGYEEIAYGVFGANNCIEFNENIFYSNTIIASQKEEGINTYINNAGIIIENIDYKFEFLAPIKSSYLNANDYSVVILLSYKNRKFMFTGDISNTIEKEIIEIYPDIPIDFLKIAHHGSNNSTCIDFLKHFTPQYAIISCKEDNVYGFPHSSTISSLMSVNVSSDNILLTSQSGNISIGVSIYGEISILKSKDILTTSVSIEYINILLSIVIFVFCFIKLEKINIKTLKK